MAYKREYKDEFVVPVFTQENGYWHRATKQFLPALMLSAPWPQQEERKKKYFPSGFPDPRYDENGIWITDPDEYPESTTYTDNKRCTR